MKDCESCRKAKNRYEKHRQARRRTGWMAQLDATPTRRRIQALMCLGYGARDVARRLGYADHPNNYVWELLEKEKVAHATHDKIALLYDELSDTPAPGSRVTKRVRTLAFKRGFAPPAAWDDIETDHAPYEPDNAEPLSDVEQYRELKALGYQDWEIAKRFGITEESLQRRLQRAAA